MHFGGSGRDRRPCDAVVLVSWFYSSVTAWVAFSPDNLSKLSGTHDALIKYMFVKKGWACVRGSLVLPPTSNAYGRKEFLVILIKQDSRLGDYKPAPRYSQLRFRATLIGIFWLWGICAMAADGLIVVPSSYGPKETSARRQQRDQWAQILLESRAVTSVTSRGADEAEPLASCTLMTRAAHSW